MGHSKTVHDFRFAFGLSAAVELDGDLIRFARRAGEFGRIFLRAEFGRVDRDFGRIGVDFEADNLALASGVAKRALLYRLGRESVLARGKRFAQRGTPFAARRFDCRRRHFALTERDEHGHFGFFARCPFEARAQVVRRGLGLDDRHFRRFGVDFEFERRTAAAFFVADAADLGRVGSELVVAGRQRSWGSR